MVGWQPSKGARAYGPRSFTVDDSGPKKKTRAKPLKREAKEPPPELFLTDEEQRIRSLVLATRAAKAKAAAFYSHAQPATDAQWEYLSAVLDWPEFQRSHVIRFVEWSNGLYGGQGSLSKWEKGKTWLSRAYFYRAIQMHKHGENEWFNGADLNAQACGFDSHMDMMFGELELPPLAKGG